MELPNWIRSAAEGFSRNRVIRRRLPERFGGHKIYMTPDSELKYWHPRVESVRGELFRWVDEFVSPGDVVWDVGSNLGLFSFPASIRVGEEGRVLSVEPDVWLASLQLRTLHDTDLGERNVEVLSAAVSDSTGIVRFSIAQRGRASNFIAEVEGPSTSGGSRITQLTASYSLDDLAEQLGPPTLVKVDVEGADLKVLAGAEHVLEEVRPTWFFELHDADYRGPVLKTFRERNYEVYDLEGATADDCGDQVTETPYHSLAVPR